MTATPTSPPHLLITTYPDFTVPTWLAARVRFDTYGESAAIQLNPTLTPRQQFDALAWAAGALRRHLSADGSHLDTSAEEYAAVLPMSRADGPTTTCTDCGTEVEPGSVPGFDLDWQCTQCLVTEMAT